MDRRSRVLAAFAAIVMSLTCASLAYAYMTSDLTDFNLTESTSTYGGGTQYHIATGTDGWASYRWLDAPSKATVVSNNTCTDWALLGSSSAYAANDTSYHALFHGGAGQCFVVRGRTQAGQGSMSLYDGRIQR
jgi:hypothetical protein